MSECGRCPAFLFDAESIRLNLCYGCRQPAPKFAPQCERCGGKGAILDGGTMYDPNLKRSRDYAKGERCDGCNGAGVLLSTQGAA